MKPLKSALFFAGILIVMQGIFYLMPTDGLIIASVHLKNPIHKIIHGGEIKPFSVKPVKSSPSPPNIPVSDSTYVKSPPGLSLSFSDSLLMMSPDLEMNDTAKIALYRLFTEFDSLREKKKHLHILYYGDSQIEGDRITSVMRDSLQRRFGGGGPGVLLPVMKVPFTASLRIETSGQWQTVSVFQKTSDVFFASPKGLFSGASILMPSGDSLVRGKCRVVFQSFASSLVRKYNRIGIWLYPLAGERGYLTVKGSGEQIAEQKIIGDTRMIFSCFSAKKAFHKLEIDFNLLKPIAVEGILLEDSVGIGVDNIPLRGRPLMDFTKCDKTILQQMFGQLNVRMVIMQFGLNVATGSKQDILYYRKTFSRQLNFLRHNFPEVFVVVVGVTDMAGQDDGMDERIQMIRDEQRRAALSLNYAFWDAYEAMGGKNSVMRWADHQPSLARPDYAHLSREGARLLARQFFNALMKDYKSYKYGK